MKYFHNKYINFLDELYGNFQFVNSDKVLIPNGQYIYHKKNFSKYFKLNEKRFKNKNILETGSGPGVHATILARMGANVKAVDISPKNIQKIKNFKKKYNLPNLSFQLYDLTKQYNKKLKYDLISCHNWVQHTPNPSLVLNNLKNNLNINGLIYISCYHANTFRFLIAQVNRSLLSINDFKKTKEIFTYFIKEGFEQFKNPDDINMENFFDDTFTPYCVTINYDNLIKDMKKIGFICVSKIPKFKNIQNIDNVFLRASFKKIKEVDIYKKNLSFQKPIDELNINNNSINKETYQLLNKAIKIMKKKDIYLRSIFCINLYLIRSKFSKDSTNAKFKILNNYLLRVVSNKLDNIRLIKI